MRTQTRYGDTRDPRRARAGATLWGDRAGRPDDARRCARRSPRSRPSRPRASISLDFDRLCREQPKRPRGARSRSSPVRSAGSGPAARRALRPAERRVLRRLRGDHRRLCARVRPETEIPLTQEDLAVLAGTSRGDRQPRPARRAGGGIVRLARGKTVVLDRTTQDVIRRSARRPRPRAPGSGSGGHGTSPPPDSCRRSWPLSSGVAATRGDHGLRRHGPRDAGRSSPPSAVLGDGSDGPTPARTVIPNAGDSGGAVAAGLTAPSKGTIKKFKVRAGAARRPEVRGRHGKAPRQGACTPQRSTPRVCGFNEDVASAVRP